MIRDCQQHINAAGVMQAENMYREYALEAAAEAGEVPAETTPAKIPDG